MLARCDGLTIFLPLPPGRKRVSDEFEVHVDRFVIVTAPLFAKRFILIRVASERARCFRARAFGIRVTARRTILARPEKRGGTPRDIVARIPVQTQVATASSSRSCRSRLEARSLLISTHETDRIRLVNSATTYTLLFPTRLSSGFLSRGCDQYRDRLYLRQN